MPQQPESRTYIPQLDGIRALAIFFVLIAHSAPMFAGPVRSFMGRFGSPGVQVFFVLSGYLITGILLREKDRPHYFRNFFARRGLRIWPLYYVVVLSCIFSRVVHRHGIHWWPYLLYISNLVYRTNHPQPNPFGPLWSLAVEEQFYLVWPLIVRFSTRKQLRFLCIAILIAAPILRTFAPFDVHTTALQLDALACGALLALHGDLAKSLKPLAWCFVWILLAGVRNQTLQVYGGSALLILAMQSDLVARLFSNAVLRFIGRISYGIYLIHLLVFGSLARTPIHRLLAFNWPGIVAYQLTLIVAAIGAAAISFHFFERPILSLKRYFEDPNSHMYVPKTQPRCLPHPQPSAIEQ